MDKSMQLLEAIGQIQDDHILDAHAPKKQNSGHLLRAVAAIAIITVGLVIFFQTAPGVAAAEFVKEKVVALIETITAAPTQPTEVPTETADEPTESTSVDPNIYSLATNYSKDEVEAFAAEIRQQVLNRNWTALSEKIAYPITISSVEYEDGAAFLAGGWDYSIPETFYQVINSEDCIDLFCNWQGIMMGDGEIWFSEILDEDSATRGLKITAINP